MPITWCNLVKHFVVDVGLGEYQEINEGIGFPVGPCLQTDDDYLSIDKSFKFTCTNSTHASGAAYDAADCSGTINNTMVITIPDNQTECGGSACEYIQWKVKQYATGALCNAGDASGEVIETTIINQCAPDDDDQKSDDRSCVGGTFGWNKYSNLECSGVKNNESFNTSLGSGVGCLDNHPNDVDNVYRIEVIGSNPCETDAPTASPVTAAPTNATDPPTVTVNTSSPTAGSGAFNNKSMFWAFMIAAVASVTSVF